MRVAIDASCALPFDILAQPTLLATFIAIRCPLGDNL